MHEHRRRVAAHPDDPDARVALAEAMLAEAATDDAVAQLERALQLDGTHRQARRMLLRIYATDRRHTKASRLLGDLVARAPHDASIHDDLADVNLVIERPDDALFHLVKADALAPDPARTEKLVQLCLARGCDARAARALRDHERRHGNDDTAKRLRELVGTASSTVETGPELVWSRLRRRLRGLTTPEPTLAGFLATLAKADARQAKRALVVLPAELRAQPVVTWLRGVIAMCAGDLDGAREAFDVACAAAVEPIRAWVHADRAELRWQRGDQAGAERDWAHARTVAPNDTDIVEAHGDALLALGKKADAERAYEAAVKHEPGGTAAEKLSRLRVRTNESGAPVAGRMRGLGWSPRGGAVTPLEAVWLRGSGALVLTGRVKHTGEEQAKVVASHLRSRRDLSTDGRDLHLHYEDTENEKDGPSAGVALALAAISAARGVPLPDDLAATGELTLAGSVRAVGGLHEKITAAFLHDVKRVLVPLANRPDIEALSSELRGSLEIVLVSTLDEALRFAFPHSEARS